MEGGVKNAQKPRGLWMFQIKNSDTMIFSTSFYAKAKYFILFQYFVFKNRTPFDAQTTLTSEVKLLTLHM